MPTASDKTREREKGTEKDSEEQRKKKRKGRLGYWWQDKNGKWNWSRVRPKFAKEQSNSKKLLPKERKFAQSAARERETSEHKEAVKEARNKAGVSPSETAKSVGSLQRKGRMGDTKRLEKHYGSDWREKLGISSNIGEKKREKAQSLSKEGRKTRHSLRLASAKTKSFKEKLEGADETQKEALQNKLAEAQERRKEARAQSQGIRKKRERITGITQEDRKKAREKGLRRTAKVTKEEAEAGREKAESLMEKARKRVAKKRGKKV